MKLSSLVLICLISIVEAGRFKNLRRDKPTNPPPTDRERACRFCYQKCPINCFVGTCGLEEGFTTSTARFGSTDRCWTCDPQASVGINQNGDFEVCSTKEAAAKAPFIPKSGVDEGPTGPSAPGDPKAASAAATAAAAKAATEAQLAADKAGELAQAAEDKKNAGAKGNAASNSDLDDKAAAAQLEAQELLKAAETATAARNVAEQKYNDELAKLRKQQLITNRAEEIMMRAGKASDDADKAKKNQDEAANQAARDAAMLGAEGAAKAAEQADAEEMAAAARGAQRRAIEASKNAKDAADKVNLAARIANTPDQPLPTLPPCDPNLKLLQVKGAQPNGCFLPQGETSPESMMPQNQEADAIVEKMAGLPAGAMDAQSQGQIPEFLRQMMQGIPPEFQAQGGVPASQMQPLMQPTAFRGAAVPLEVDDARQAPAPYNDQSLPQNPPPPPIAINDEGTQSDFVPGMLSTIQRAP